MMQRVHVLCFFIISAIFVFIPAGLNAQDDFSFDDSGFEAGT